MAAVDPFAVLVLALLVVGLVVWLLARRAEGRRAAELRAAEPVSLREASALVAVSLDSLRKAADRDPRFPTPVRLGARRAKLYDPAEIVAWFRSRPGRPARLDQGLDRWATVRAAERS